jgi:hypothetical protein
MEARPTAHLFECEDLPPIILHADQGPRNGGSVTLPVRLETPCLVMAGLVLTRPGHPRLAFQKHRKKDVDAATSAGMTTEMRFNQIGTTLKGRAFAGG